MPCRARIHVKTSILRCVCRCGWYPSPRWLTWQSSYSRCQVSLELSNVAALQQQLSPAVQPSTLCADSTTGRGHKHTIELPAGAAVSQREHPSSAAPVRHAADKGACCHSGKQETVLGLSGDRYTWIGAGPSVVVATQQTWTGNSEARQRLMLWLRCTKEMQAAALVKLYTLGLSTLREQSLHPNMRDAAQSPRAPVQI